MPAETHQHGSTVTADAIVDLLAVCVPGQEEFLADATVRCLRDEGGQT